MRRMIRRGAIAFWFIATAVLLRADISGIATGPDGAPVQGAVVGLYACESESDRAARLRSDKPDRVPLARATAGDDGRFLIPLKAPAVVDLVVSAEGRRLFASAVDVNEQLGAVVLMPAGRRTGIVTAAGKPVGGATVVWGADVIARTDATGHYTVPELAAPSRLSLLHPDYARHDSFVAVDATVDLKQQLSPGVSVKGVAVADDGKTPVAHAGIFFAHARVGETADDGSFTVAHLPEKWQSIVISDGSRVAGVPNSGAALKRVRLLPAARITGVVRSSKDQRPVGGGTVYVISSAFDLLSANSVIADDAGRFAFSGLPAGTYQLNVNRPGFFLEGAVSLTVAAGSSASRELSMRPAAQLRGTVVGEDHKPVGGALVAFGPSLANSNGRAMTLSAPDGAFVLRNIYPSGLYGFVVAFKEGYAAARNPLSGSADAPSNMKIILPRGFRLDARVTDVAGATVSDAVLSFARWDDDTGNTKSEVPCFAGAAERCFSTGADGTLHLRIADGTYDVGVRGPDLVSKSLRGQKLSSRSGSLAIAVQRGVVVRGRLLYRDGTPVADIGVVVKNGRSTVLSDSNGAFELHGVPAGRVTLMATGAGRRPEEQEITAPADDVKLILPRPGRIEGRVIDRATRQPLTDFQVQIGGTRIGNMVTSSSDSRREFHADDGSFALENVAVGSVELVASAAGYIPGRRSDINVEEGKPVVGVELALDRGTKLTGRVTDPDGNPLAGVSVQLDRSQVARPYGGGSPGMQQGQTDSNGEFALDGLAPGETPVLFNKQGFLSKRKIVEITDKDARVEIPLMRGKSLRGIVVDEAGSPVAAADVSVSSAAADAQWSGARSDADGSFTLEGLANTQYSVTARKQGYLNAVLKGVDVASAQTITLTLRRGGSISGRVTGLSEAELGDVWVSASSMTSRARAQTDSTGAFRIDGVSDGVVTVIAAVTGNQSRQTPPKQVEVRGGTAAPVELEFVQGNSVSGHVRRRGNGVERAAVQFSPQEPGLPNGYAYTASDGSYRVDGLGSGKYRVYVSLGGGPVRWETYTVAGNSTYDVDLRDGSLRGQIVDDATGHPLSDVSVTVEPAESGAGRGMAVTDSDGRYVVESLSAGKYRIRTQKNAYGPEVRDATVSDDVATQADLRLHPVDGIRLRVVDARDGTALSAFFNVTDSSNRVLYAGQGSVGDDGSAKVFLQQGDYQVRISAAGYAWQQVSVHVPSDAEVRVPMTHGGSLVVTSKASTIQRLRLTRSDAGGSPRPERWLTVQPGVNPPVENIPSGALTLEVVGSDGKATRSYPVQILEGTPTAVVVEP
jgi:hypothetical protein